MCYYGPGQAMGRSYWATYAVYRRNDSGEGEHYERVSGIFSAVRATADVIAADIDPTDGLIQERSFMCYNDSVDASDSPLTVQDGDIIGACVFDPQEDDVSFSRRQLNIVGDIMNGVSLWRSSNADGCTMDTIPSSVLRSTLEECDDRRLHIYANIGNNHCPQGDIV